MSKEKALVILPRISVINVNLISGPLTWGFPAMTAFLGAVHSMMRRLPEMPFSVDGVGVVCHDFTPQVSRSQGSFTYGLHLNRFPVDEHGKSASFIEDGRAHMTVSLVIQVDTREAGLTDEEGQPFAKAMMDTLQGMRLAGGSIVPSRRTVQPLWKNLAESQEEQRSQFRRIRRRLLPGFALVDRRDLFVSHLEEMHKTDTEASPLDALLDLCALHHEPPAEKDGSWTSGRRYPGWLVPIPVGYRAISELYEGGKVKNTRDEVTPFRFVESICSLGEWKSPHRFELPQEMLWRYEEDIASGEYRTVPLTRNTR
ncbi:type I-F CRISPR-associated protein Csy2 [Mailhella sp.]|uniref:type I-F CRISPR-associated protein Csy2 n=1 Tax=Mailhella sp. TaxID=1981029 RepID=UPI0040633B56